MHRKLLRTLATAAGVLAIAGLGALIAAPRGGAASERQPSCFGAGLLVAPFGLAAFPKEARVYLGTLETRSSERLTLRIPRRVCGGRRRVTLRLPADTTFRRDGAAAQIGDLRKGDTVAAIFSRGHGDVVLAGGRQYMRKHGLRIGR